MLQDKTIILTSKLLSIHPFSLLNGEICPFHSLLGIPCPGCGMTRAFLALLRGDVRKAFYWHPLFPLVILIFLVFLLKRKYKVIENIWQNKLILKSVILLFILCYIIRLCFLFPDQPPLNLNKDSLLGQLLKLIIK